MTPNTSGATVGSFALTASSAGGVQVNTVSVEVLPNGNSGVGGSTPFQNLRIMVNGAQFGTTQAVVGSTASGGSTYVFSGSPFTVPAGGTTVVNVLADTLSSVSGSTTGGATMLTGCTGTGLVSYNSVSCNSVTGQNISFNANGTTLAITSDFSQQASTQYVMPSQQVALATFDFSENKNIEPVKLTQLVVTDAVASSGVKAAFSNLQLYNGANSVAQVQSGATGVFIATATTTLTGSAVGPANVTSSVIVNGVSYVLTVASGSAATAATIAPTLPTGLTMSPAGGLLTFTAGSGKYVISVGAPTGGTGITLTPMTATIGNYYTYTFSSFAPNLVIPQNGTLPLVLKGDLPNWTAGAVSDNTTSTFSVATPSDVTALGASSSKAPTVTLTSAAGNPMTVLRTTLTPSIASVGGTRAARSSQDEVATVTFTANSAGPATLNYLQLTFSGSLVSSSASSSFTSNNVQLWLNGAVLTFAQAVLSTSTTNGSVAKWTFQTGGTAGTQIPAGGSDVFQVVINDSGAGTVGPTGSVSLGLNIAVQNNTDVQYMDSSLSDSTAATVSLPANIVPIATQVGFNQGV